MLSIKQVNENKQKSIKENQKTRKFLLINAYASSISFLESLTMSQDLQGRKKRRKPIFFVRRTGINV